METGPNVLTTVSSSLNVCSFHSISAVRRHEIVITDQKLEESVNFLLSILEPFSSCNKCQTDNKAMLPSSVSFSESESQFREEGKAEDLTLLCALLPGSVPSVCAALSSPGPPHEHLADIGSSFGEHGY